MEAPVVDIQPSATKADHERDVKNLVNDLTMRSSVDNQKGAQEKLPGKLSQQSTSPLLGLLDRLRAHIPEEGLEEAELSEDAPAISEQLRAEAVLRESAQNDERNKAESLVLAFFRGQKEGEVAYQIVKGIMKMIEEGDVKRFEAVFNVLCDRNKTLRTTIEADPTLALHLRERFARQAILLYGSRDIPKDEHGKDREERFTKQELTGIVEWIGKEKIGAFITGNLEVAQQLLGDDFDPKGDVMAQIRDKLKEGKGGNIWRIILLLLGVTTVTMLSGARSVAA